MASSRSPVLEPIVGFEEDVRVDIAVSCPDTGGTGSGSGGFTIGRSSRCSYRVNNGHASGVHCVVSRVDDSTYRLTDKSTNGTVVNGTILGKGNYHELSTGDNVVVVPGAFEFRWKAPLETRAPVASAYATAQEKTELTSRTDSQRDLSNNTRAGESPPVRTTRRHDNGTSATEHVNSMSMPSGNSAGPASNRSASLSPIVMEEHSDTERQDSAALVASLATRLSERAALTSSSASRLANMPRSSSPPRLPSPSPLPSPPAASNSMADSATAGIIGLKRKAKAPLTFGDGEDGFAGGEGGVGLSTLAKKPKRLSQVEETEESRRLGSEVAARLRRLGLDKAVQPAAKASAREKLDEALEAQQKRAESESRKLRDLDQQIERMQRPRSRSRSPSPGDSRSSPNASRTIGEHSRSGSPSRSPAADNGGKLRGQTSPQGQRGRGVKRRAPAASARPPAVASHASFDAGMDPMDRSFVQDFAKPEAKTPPRKKARRGAKKAAPKVPEGKQIFRGCVGMFVGGKTTTLVRISRQKFEDYGGEIVEAYESERVTHVLCVRGASRDMVERALGRSVVWAQSLKVLRLDWISASIQHGSQVDVQRYLLFGASFMKPIVLAKQSSSQSRNGSSQASRAHSTNGMYDEDDDDRSSVIDSQSSSRVKLHEWETSQFASASQILGDASQDAGASSTLPKFAFSPDRERLNARPSPSLPDPTVRPSSLHQRAPSTMDSMYFSPNMQDDIDIEPENSNATSSRESPRYNGSSSFVEQNGARSLALESLDLDESLPNDEARVSQPAQRAVYQAKSDGGNLFVIRDPSIPCASPKVAGFDLDGTLIKTRSGAVFAKGAEDWKFFSPEVPTKLLKYHAKGYRIVVFTNQKGVSLKRVKIPQLTEKLQQIGDELKVPLLVMAATHDDRYRKPNVGMWAHLKKLVKREEGVELDLSSSFFVGDAAGRSRHWSAGAHADHSCSDRKFAMNLGIKFHTPEEFFFDDAPAPFVLEPNLSDIAESKSRVRTDTPQQWHRPTQEVVLFMGYPGSGKTTFFKKHFYPRGYKHVNRDTLKSMERCRENCERYLRIGKSVCVDNTNPDLKSRAPFLSIARREKLPVRCLWFTTDMPLSKHLNRLRFFSKKAPLIPDSAYKRYESTFQPPRESEGFSSIEKVDFVANFGSAEERARFLKYTC